MGDNGTFGYKGFKNRALELPAGVTTGLAVAPAPTDRARFRYNSLARQIEASVDGSDYEPLTVAQGALSQPSFFIDPVSGDDSAAGDSALTALATLAEYESRVGDGTVTVAQVVNVLGTLSEGTYRVRGSYPLGLTIQGVRTLVRSGSVSAIQAWNTAVTPIVDQRITDASLSGTWSNSGPAGSSLIGKLIVLTSGAHVGKVASAIEDLEAISAKTARVSQFVNIFTFATGTPAVADTFDVVDLTRINGVIIFENRDVPGFGFIDLEDVAVVSPGGQPLLGGSGFIAAGSAIFRQALSLAGTLSGCDLLCVGTLFGSGCSLGLAQTSSTSSALVSCAFIDARIEVKNATLSFIGINAMQRTTVGVFIASNQLTIFQGAIVSVFGSFGAFDLNGAAQACVRINAGGILDITGVVYTFATVAGFGVFVDAVASALWTAGGSAVTFGRFDGGTEWRIGGVNTTSAALGAAGSITAANHAVAVPHPT